MAQTWRTKFSGQRILFTSIYLYLNFKNLVYVRAYILYHWSLYHSAMAKWMDLWEKCLFLVYQAMVLLGQKCKWS